MPPSLLYFLKYTILLELKRYEEAEQGIEKCSSFILITAIFIIIKALYYII